MAEFPALPLWTDAYLGDTTHLSTFEHGAYLLLLIISWRSPGCCLPDDDALLARYSKMTRDKWGKVRPILAPFFDIYDGFWHQARLQDEFQHLQSQKVNASKAGKASAAAKLLKRQHRGSTSVGLPLQRKGNGKATPIPTPITEDKSSAAKAADPVKELFDLGISLLVEAGVDESRARALIGKWRRDTKSDSKVLDGILKARAQSISEPVEWLEKLFKGARYVSPTGYEYRGDDKAVMKEAERRADWGTYWAAKKSMEQANA